EKLAHEKSFAKAGDLIHYYFELTNEGIVPVVKLTVNDPKLGIEDLVIDLGDDPLMPGDTLTYEFAEAYVVTEADVAAGKVENVLTVIGESPDGAEDEVTDDLVVPMEKILPHVPSTGEYISRWTAIGALILGGAVALILINRRRKLNQS
ncbi:MAG TPA: LPXTG cell wall anchor domain-containing protein, partial [Fastidiosipila sp.]|nr:LPXTG cell wall anchor domain-containing protein [Fastidiosipila sp.]